MPAMLLERQATLAALAHAVTKAAAGRAVGLPVAGTEPRPGERLTSTSCTGVRLRSPNVERIGAAAGRPVDLLKVLEV